MVFLFQNGTRQARGANKSKVVTPTLVPHVLGVSTDSKGQMSPSDCRQQGVETVQSENGRDLAIKHVFPVVNFDFCSGLGRTNPCH